MSILVHFFDVHCTTTMWKHLVWRFMKDAVNKCLRSFLTLQYSTPGEIAYIIFIIIQIMQVQIDKVWKDTNSSLAMFSLPSSSSCAAILAFCSQPSPHFLSGGGGGVYTISRVSFFREHWKYHFRASRFQTFSGVDAPTPFPTPPPTNSCLWHEFSSAATHPPPCWNCTPLSLQFQFSACTGYVVTYQKITCHMGSTSSGYMEKYRSAKSVGCSELSFKLVQHWRYFVRLSKTISARRSFP